MASSRKAFTISAGGARAERGGGGLEVGVVRFPLEKARGLRGVESTDFLAPGPGGGAPSPGGEGGKHSRDGGGYHPRPPPRRTTTPPLVVSTWIGLPPRPRSTESRRWRLPWTVTGKSMFMPPFTVEASRWALYPSGTARV